MRAHNLSGITIEDLLNPFDGPWSRIRSQTLELTGTPSALQPTSAVRVAFPEGTIGAVKSVDVAVAHNGQMLAFRLRWADASLDTGPTAQDDTTFSDGAAVLFPVVAGAPLMSMGAPGMPVTAWYWRADEARHGRHVTAEGLGTSDTLDREQVKIAATHRDGYWHVVIARALNVRSRLPAVQLVPGRDTPFSVAIWEGGHRERAGIKSFALGQHDGWHDLIIDPQA